MVEQYLSQIPGDEENKRRIVRRYASLIVSDIRKQIYEHMDRKTQDVHIIQKDLILFRKFVKNVKEDGRVRYDKPFTDKSNIKKYLFTGYTKSYYPANAFDSDTERLFSIILEEDPDVIRWIKPPLNQLGLFWKAGQQYMLKRSCPELSDAHCEDIVASILGAMTMSDSDKVSLVVTAPPSFTIKARTTMNVVQSMINGADRNILITGYSLSSYFSELVDTIIQKSQRGVFVKFFVNDIDKQPSFDKILRYKGRFLKIYNYRQDDDKMAALHAKVISVDQQQTLITSANLSYHGQQGNIELGTLIESKQIAKQIDDIFTKLIFTKDFCEI